LNFDHSSFTAKAPPKRKQLHCIIPRRDRERAQLLVYKMEVIGYEKHGKEEAKEERNRG
jgi:hypothetical protein